MILAPRREEFRNLIDNMPYGLLVDIGRESAYPLRSTPCKNAEAAAVIIGDYLRLQCPGVSLAAQIR